MSSKKSSEESEEVEGVEEVEEPVEPEEVEVVEERFYTINLRDAWATPRSKRTPKAVRVLKDYIRRHMKVDDFKISNEVNQMVWGRSLKKPPRRLMVRAVKDKEGNVIIFPAKSA